MRSLVPTRRQRRPALAAAGGALVAHVLGRRRALADARAAHAALAAETRRLRASEAALREAEEHLQRAFEEAPIGTGIVALDGRWLDANRALCRLLGHARDELLRRSIQELAHPADAAADVRALEQFRAGTRDAYQVEKRYVRADGEELWAQVNVSRVRLGGGAADHLVAQVQDISARRRSEARLRAAEQRFRLAFEAAPIGISLESLDGRRLRVNRAYCEMFGYAEAELIGTDAAELVHPLDVDEHRDRMRRELAGEVVAPRERRSIDRAGDVVWVQARTTLVRDDDGEPLYVISQLVDITERVAAQREIEHLLADQHAILASAGEGIYRVDAGGRITFVNPSAAALLGWEAGELLGRDAHPTLHHAHPDGTPSPREGCALHLCLRDGRVGRGTGETFWRRDGSSFPADWTSAPIREGDAPSGAVVVFRDVTEQLAAEEERLALQQRLRQVERLDTVGKLASGIAHDFNNLLAVISTYAALLADEVHAGARGDVEQIRSAARSAAELTRRLLILGRRDVGHDEPVELNALVRSTEELLRGTLGERTALVTRLGDELSPVVADRAQLEQLVLNLVINARDAMPDGGTLEIETANADVAEGAVPGLAAGAYVRLRVRDSGCGMDEDVVAHAFEPFFTTKPHGEGTGLGLTTVYAIATQAGGTVELRSAPGRGTAVAVFLPAAQGAVPGDPGASAAAHGSTLPFRTVVVVEDDDRLRAAATELLRRRGLHVEPVASGDAALALLGAGGGADVVLTDVVMPGITGPELARELRRVRPGLPVVFMTGHSDDATLTAESAICVAKPFEEAQLLDALERAVISAPAAG